MKVVAILAIIIAIIWFFPPTNRLIVQFYEENVIVKTVVDISGRILQGLWNATKEFFQNAF